MFSLADDVSGGGLDAFRHGVALRRVRCKDKLKKNGREDMVGGFQRVSIGEIQPCVLFRRSTRVRSYVGGAKETNACSAPGLHAPVMIEELVEERQVNIDSAVPWG